MKQRKIPMRMCTACRESKPKRELIRIVRDKEGNISVDTTGKVPGRGAYLCADLACLEKAAKTRALARALECDITDDTMAQIKRVILRREIER